MIWDYSLEELILGYAEKDICYKCVLCRKLFKKGKIYEHTGELFDAYGSIKAHIKSEHGTTADCLLTQRTSLTGISEVQNRILTLISAGKTDKEISQSIGTALSTVKNHRFKLREKKQAKLFLALMQSLEQKRSSNIAASDL